MNAKVDTFPDGETGSRNQTVSYSYEILSILPQKESSVQVPKYRDMLIVLSGRPGVVPEAGASKGKRLLLPLGRPVYLSRPYRIYSRDGQARIMRVIFPSEGE